MFSLDNKQTNITERKVGKNRSEKKGMEEERRP
jgi:hypothetical protein